MTLLDKISSLAKADPQRIVLSEGEDQRVVTGGLRAAADGLAHVTFIGDRAKFSELAAGHPEADSCEVISPTTSPLLASFIDRYVELRKHRGATPENAREALRHPLNFAAMMVREGHGDGTIGGAQYTTTDTVRAALQIIGKAKGSSIVSSFFLMILNTPEQRPIVFADCALIVLPTAEQLAEIAIASAGSYATFIGDTPRVALLAFSTHGSATDERLTHVIDATRIAKEREPSLILDGELQFDAAFVPAIGQKKAPGSALQGDANVFIFPDLHSGNIGYKIAQRIGGAAAIGPILQGLAKPANDLSRGCTSDDVYHMIAVTAAQAAGQKRASS